MVRVWFNKGYKNLHNLVELIKNNEDGQEFYVIGTDSTEETYYKAFCDDFKLEPNGMCEKSYLDWCLKFCEDHEIELFLPRLHLKFVGKNLYRFDKIGTKVMVDPNIELTEILNNKQKTAELFEKHGLCKTHDIELAKNLEEFQEGYKKIKERMGEGQVCIKYSECIGGRSYRVIDDKASDISSLDRRSASRISYNQLEDILGSTERFRELMIMPNLDGLEISIDSINTSKGFIAVPRHKRGGIRVIDMNKEYIEISRIFAEITGIKYAYNLQLKYHKDELYLLEVNARMSGGVHYANLVGVNIPYLTIKEILGQEINLPKVSVGNKMKITKVDVPVII